ncbi:hypothetical protein FHL15_008172 [Xylaria flabelliformis]|uniref:Rhodopsin domain-containing protein n=1 Tax=Xylaria flabelliformis TaxID=2512241 RepID=A0A553HSQ2_9PEZI|nr:hypothetical protein FHL15_008172 [Xylaria flabelliformis]
MASQLPPPSVLWSTPAGNPPPGMVSNLIDPETNKTPLQVTLSIFLALAVFAVAVRCYVQLHVVNHKPGWDDLMLLFALWTRVINSLPQPLTGFVKLSILTFYLRVFGVQRIMKILTIFGIIFVSVLYTTFTIAFAVVDSTIHRPAVVKLSITQAAISVVTDLYLLILPISSVLRLQMSRSRKLAIVGIFSSGLAALLLSTLTLYWRSENSVGVETDSTWFAAENFTVSLVEIDIGILCACMPLFGPLMTGVGQTTKVWTNYLRLKGSQLRLYSSRRSRGLQNGHSNGSHEHSVGGEPGQKGAIYMELEERNPKPSRSAKKHWFDRSVVGVSTMGTDTTLNDDRGPLV